MPRHLMFVLLVVIVVGYAVPLGHSEVVGVKRVLTQMPVMGRLEHGGTFAGRLTIEELTVNDSGQLAATGVLAGTATPKRLFEKSSIGGTSSVHWRDDCHTIPYRPD